MTVKLHYTLTIGLTCLALASCISTGTTWKRDGATLEQFKLDKETCRSLAQEKAEDNYNNSVKYRFGTEINNDFSYNKLMRQHDARRDTRSFFELCLGRRGYKKATAPKGGQKI